jgi:hypothetical protein
MLYAMHPTFVKSTPGLVITIELWQKKLPLIVGQAAVASLS